jgi:acetyl-CoA carboxylase carboxyltransferase component
VGSTGIGGIGVICGTFCVVVAHVGKKSGTKNKNKKNHLTSSFFSATINGGTIRPPAMLRMGRLSDIAMENRLPLIRLTESGGADLRVQAEVFHKGGAGFYHQAKLSKANIPQISVVFGNATAGGAYGPGMSDYTIMVREKGLMFLGGPPLVKMATGEEANEEDLGGALMHSSVSGVSDYMAMSEIDALKKTREVVATLNLQPAQFVPPAHFLPFDEPLYAPEELLGIVSPNLKKRFDMSEVIARLVDGSRMSEFKPLYGPSVICCWAKIQGMLVGIIANRDGVIFSESALKASQFIYLCNQKNTPILFLHNVTGFMVGTSYEKNGIIKHGSQMINAVSNSCVPHFTIIVGSSYGAGNYAMCGRMYNPKFLWSWPQSRCAVMGGEQLAGVLDIVSQRSAAKKGIKINEQEAAFKREMFKQMVDKTADVYYTSSRGIDDGVIDPRDTREILGLCLEIVQSNVEVKGGNTFGISRL